MLVGSPSDVTEEEKKVPGCTPALAGCAPAEPWRRPRGDGDDVGPRIDISGIVMAVKTATSHPLAASPDLFILALVIGVGDRLHVGSTSTPPALESCSDEDDDGPCSPTPSSSGEAPRVRRRLGRIIHGRPRVRAYTAHSGVSFLPPKCDRSRSLLQAERPC